jgi:hypothetical protein
MAWVNVPVPEEYVEDVHAYLFQLRFRSDVPEFDSIAMGDHILSLTDEQRAMLFVIAAAVAEGQPPEDTRVAEDLGVSVREVFGLVTEVNDITVRPFTGNLVFSLRQPRADNPGETVRRLHMLLGHAQMVVEQRRVLELA